MKKSVYIVVILILILVINNLIHSIWDLYQKKDVLVKTQKQLQREKEKSQKLKAALSYVQSNEFLEEEARNKLFLIKPGEQEILMPKGKTEKKVNELKKDVPNWQKWLNLFF